MLSQPWRFGLILTVFALLASASQAQTYRRFLLSQEEYRALSEQAEVHYSAAINHLNHIDYDYALNSMRQAAEAAPDHAAVQFRLYDLAVRQARLSTSRRAEDHRVIAMQALQRVVDNPSASDPNRMQAESAIRTMREEMAAAVSQQDARRTATRNFVYSFALENTWYEISRKTSRTPAILTASGPGNIVTRSEVITIDSRGMIFDAQGQPRDGNNGTQLNKDTLINMTLNMDPDAAFFRGEDPSQVAVSGGYTLDDLDGLLGEDFMSGMDSAPSSGQSSGMMNLEINARASMGSTSLEVKPIGSLSPVVFPSSGNDGTDPFNI